MRTICYLSLAFMMALLSTGCSYIGLTADSLSDRGFEDCDTLSTTQAWQIAPGKDIIVLTTDEARISGEFIALDSVPMAEYRKAYNELKNHAGGAGLPALNESVIVTFKPDARRPPLQGTFVGFDPGIIRICLEKRQVGIPLAAVDWLDGLQDPAETTYLPHKGVNIEGVPFLSQMKINTGARIRAIRLDAVRCVYLDNPKNASLIGLGATALVDSLVLAVGFEH